MAKYLLLTFDLEEFVLADEYNLKMSEKDKYGLSTDGLKRIIGLLHKHNIKCTFFTTYQFAAKAKQPILELVKNGHEIALHGYSHDKKPFRDRKSMAKLAEAKEKIEKMFKIKVSGFRTPQLQGVDYIFLKKIGIQYDSSYHPTYLPGYYNHFFGPRNVFTKDGMLIVPISVAALFRMPFSWIFFRNLPLIYSKFCSSLANINTDYLNIYIHPWEFADLNKNLKINNLKNDGIIYKLSVNKTGSYLVNKLDNYISWLKKNNYQGITVKDYLLKKGLL